MILENANFSHQLTACFGDLTEFEHQIRQIADIVGIDINEFEIDHLAVRMNKETTAKEWKSIFTLPFADLLKESDVNGRPICLFTLKQPLTFCHQAVSIIELPFPKEKTYSVEGWEHIELVVPMQEGENVEQWVKRLYKRWNLDKNLQIKLKVSEPKVEGERLPNPSIAISLTEKSLNNHATIKLHPYAISEICQVC